MPGQSEPEPTVWRVFADLTHHTYYFNGANSLNTVVMQLDRFNLKAGAPVLKLDILHKPELSGDVTDKFQPFN
jgi:choloylglycine hydrolase